MGYVPLMTARAGVGFIALLVGCGAPPEPTTTPLPATTAAPASPAPSTLVLEPSWQNAFNRAEKKGQLVVLDMGAEWCHSCASMTHYVLSDERLGPLNQLVQVAVVDVEAVGNEQLVERYDIRVLPSYLAVEPKSGRVFGYWRGTATVRELDAFVRGAAEAYDQSQARGLERGSALHHLVAGHDAAARSSARRAFQSYSTALELAPASWPQRSDAAFGAFAALHDSDAWTACAQLGTRVLPTLRDTRAASGTRMLLSCALEASDDVREQAVKVALGRLIDMANEPPAELPVDDQAEVFAALAELLDALGKKELAQKAMQDGLTRMEAAAAGAKSPERVAVFDTLRMNAYFFLGRGDDALRMMDERVQQLPQSALAHSRRAWVLEQLSRYQEALDTIRKAHALASGKQRRDYERRIWELEQKLEKSAPE